MLTLFVLLSTALPFYGPTPYGADQSIWAQQRRARGGREQATADRRSSIAPDNIVRYGTASSQTVDYYAAPATAMVEANGQRPPLAIFIHGGGWRLGDQSMVAAKPAWFRAHGWAFASIGYRLLPEASVETQAQDIAAAIVALRRDAAHLGFDPDRILLFGHSAGAHLAALLSTDDRLLGADFAAIQGTILLDGAGYDVVRQMAAARFLAQRIYEPAFGTDPARQRALSPITYAGGRDVPSWLIIHDNDRDDSVAQSTAFATALTNGGAMVQRLPMEGTHMSINIDFGNTGYAGNAAIEAIMRRVTGQR
ncbi:MAG: alpha/beta hydrolase [Pseudomonadota bacterium]